MKTGNMIVKFHGYKINLFPLVQEKRLEKTFKHNFSDKMVYANIADPEEASLKIQPKITPGYPN